MSEDVRCHLVEIILIKTWLGYIIDGLACCPQCPIQHFEHKKNQNQDLRRGSGGQHQLHFLSWSQSVRAEGGADHVTRVTRS